MNKIHNVACKMCPSVVWVAQRFFVVVYFALVIHSTSLRQQRQRLQNNRSIHHICFQETNKTALRYFLTVHINLLILPSFQ